MICIKWLPIFIRTKTYIRSEIVTFSHFVEVCGMLTIHDRNKKRENITVSDALCKAMGWYFPLMAKMKIRSIEEIVYRKFPYACPYCRKTPHDDAICKQVRGTERTVNHSDLRNLYELNQQKMPVGLDDWQKMFQEIYPRSTEDRGRSTIGLLEELGEISEAIRVFEKHPKYFVGEAADTFSYLMGIANEHTIREAKEDREFSFEREFLRRYPGLCPQCGSRVCICPAVPEATIGRLTKELDIGSVENLFLKSIDDFSEEGRAICHRVLERAGGFSALVSELPFDRGDANHALVLLCIKLADVIQNENLGFAERLRAEAYKIGSLQSKAGTKEEPLNAQKLFAEIAETWRGLDSEIKLEIKSDTGEIVDGLTHGMGTINILFVSCSPKDQEGLRVGQELRAANEASKLGPKGNSINIKNLPAATIEDLRREMLERPYEIVQFSGHADATNLCFETADGKTSDVPLIAIKEFLERREFNL
jgi:NTP pyrophosphatase (non-canonical NTP hydrolase)